MTMSSRMTFPLLRFWSTQDTSWPALGLRLCDVPRDFAAEIERYEACFAAATEECPEPISLAADLASHEIPLSSGPTVT